MIYSPPHIHDGARWAGLRVGLLGGSFNPPHDGHIHASVMSLRSLKLDAVWWLVTPQNPLKRKAEMDFETRFNKCRELIHRPDIIVSDIEKQLGENITWKTIRALNYHFPQADFVFITGMDNAHTLHKWHNWTYILDNIATAHVARPPAWNLIKNCPLRMRNTQNHIQPDRAAEWPLKPRYTYWLMQKRMLDISSTEIRKSHSKQSFSK